jgi:hypothetical protein
MEHMSTRQIRVTLTEQEYEALKAEAEREKRTLSQQAAYRLTRPPLTASYTRDPFGIHTPIGSGQTSVRDDSKTLRIT